MDNQISEEIKRLKSQLLFVNKLNQLLLSYREIVNQIMQNCKCQSNDHHSISRNNFQSLESQFSLIMKESDESSNGICGDNNLKCQMTNNESNDASMRRKSERISHKSVNDLNFNDHIISSESDDEKRKIP